MFVFKPFFGSSLKKFLGLVPPFPPFSVCLTLVPSLPSDAFTLAKRLTIPLYAYLSLIYLPSNKFANFPFPSRCVLQATGFLSLPLCCLSVTWTTDWAARNEGHTSNVNVIQHSHRYYAHILYLYLSMNRYLPPPFHHHYSSLSTSQSRHLTYLLH